MRCVAVDDDTLALRFLEVIIGKITGVELIALFDDQVRALDEIPKLLPDLVFLDINMPGIDGLSFLARLSERMVALPLVVFATAHSEFAVEAFDTQAVDYVMKPFSFKRIEQAMLRAHRLLEKGVVGAHPLNAFRILEAREKIESLTRASVSYDGPKRDRIIIKHGSQEIFIDVENISWISAEGDYVRLAVGAQNFFIRERLKSFLAQLPTKVFMQVHRSHIINLERANAIIREGGHKLRVLMADGTLIPISRASQKSVRHHLINRGDY